MRITKLALAACAVALVALPAAADTAGDLTVDKLKVRQTKKGDNVSLKLSLPSDFSLQTIDMSTAPFRISLGGATVFELPPAGQRPKLVNTGFLD